MSFNENQSVVYELVENFVKSQECLASEGLEFVDGKQLFKGLPCLCYFLSLVLFFKLLFFFSLCPAEV